MCPPMPFFLPSSWSMVPAEVVRTMNQMTGWKQALLPFFWIFELHIKSGADYSTLVQPTCEGHNFPSFTVISDFKFTSVTRLHHHS